MGVAFQHWLCLRLRSQTGATDNLGFQHHLWNVTIELQWLQVYPPWYISARMHCVMRYKINSWAHTIPVPWDSAETRAASNKEHTTKTRKMAIHVEQWTRNGRNILQTSSTTLYLMWASVLSKFFRRKSHLFTCLKIGSLLHFSDRDHISCLET